MWHKDRGIINLSGIEPKYKDLFDSDVTSCDVIILSPAFKNFYDRVFKLFINIFF